METVAGIATKPKRPFSNQKNNNKKKEKKKLSIPQLKDATNKIWAQFALWCQRRCCLKVLTMTDYDGDNNGELFCKLFRSLLL